MYGDEGDKTLEESYVTRLRGVENADGRVREVQVVSGLSHGLTEAAIVALKQCRFSPGEKDGRPVSVRVREFKIRFC